MAKKNVESNGTPEPAAPSVPPRRSRQAAQVEDPIVAALKEEGSPQLGGAFPPEEPPVREVHYNPSPPIPAHLLHQYTRVNDGPPDGAVSSLMYAVLNQRRDVGTKFHMLLVPEVDSPSMHEFDTVDELRQAVKSHLGTSTYVFCFLGHALRITKGPFHFLQTPYGAVSLHDIPSPTDQESLSDGWMGPALPITEFVSPPVPTGEETDDISDFDESLYIEAEDDVSDDDIPQDETDLFE